MRDFNAMIDNQKQTTELFFNTKFDQHQHRISKLETFRAVAEQRLENTDRRYDDVCNLLMKNNAEVVEKLTTQGKVIEHLYNDKLRAEGARAQWKLLYALIGFAYTLLQIYVLLAVTK